MKTIEITDELYEQLVHLADKEKCPIWDDSPNFNAREIWIDAINDEQDEEDACFTCYEAGTDDGMKLIAREIILGERRTYGTPNTDIPRRVLKEVTVEVSGSISIVLDAITEEQAVDMAMHKLMCKYSPSKDSVTHVVPGIGMFELHDAEPVSYRELK